jgi:hypothetical protein
MARLPDDRLPKGTRFELSVLLKRCLMLEAHGVRMPRYGIVALQRVLQYLDRNDVEGGKR